MKKLISFLLVLAMLFCVAGCASDSEPDKKGDSTKATEDSTKATEDNNTVPAAETALTVGEHQISDAVLSYFYMDGITSFCNKFSSYGDLADLYLQLYTGLSLTTALDQQYYDTESQQTWADYFIESAVERAKWTYVMYDAAMAAQYTLPEDLQKELDAYPKTLETYASYLSYKDVNSYLRDVYGEKSDVDSYVEYYRRSWIAAEFAEQHYMDLTFTPDALAAYEVGKEVNYNSYSFATYFVSVSKYAQHLFGKLDTYTEEQLEQARQEANALVDDLAAKATSVDALNQAVQQANPDTSLFAATCIEAAYTLYSEIGNEDVRNWLAAPERSLGDTAVIPVYTNDAVEGFYVILLEHVDNNNAFLANVQHILISAKKEEEKDAARAKAAQILAEFQNSAVQDSATFGELAKTYSEDAGSKNNGGLYEGVCRNHYYVENFENWAVAGHQPGDTGIVETEYGVHIMYYKEDGAMTYRQHMIESDLRDETQIQWEKETVEAVTSSLHSTLYLATDLIITGQ